MPFADDAARNLPDLLAARLHQPLPGEASQAAFQPELSHGRHFHAPPPWARPAAVLLLLYRDAGRWHLPLVLRPGHLNHHAGQVAFPGGAVEAGESPTAAALRELEVDVGVAPVPVRRPGQCTPVDLSVHHLSDLPWGGG